MRPFYEIILWFLTPKPDEDNIRKQIYRTISLMQLDTKVLNTCSNQIQKYFKGINITTK